MKYTGRSFAKPANQARKLLARALAHHRVSDHDAEILLPVMTRIAEWDRANGGRGLVHIDTHRASTYLAVRYVAVDQDALELDRRALLLLPNVRQLDLPSRFGGSE